MSGRDFWSRRREAVAEEAQAEQVALAVAEAEQTEAQLSERDDAEILEELGLPEPETLDSSESVREFLGSAVPQRLKTRALRRLWRLNPVLANLDGLVDYGEDYTDAATVIENLQTAYQVGKGMLAHVEELARQAEEKETAEAVSDDFAEEKVDNEDDTAQTEIALSADPDPAQPEPYPEDAEPSAPEMPAGARRRMHFQFETTV